MKRGLALLLVVGLLLGLVLWANARGEPAGVPPCEGAPISLVQGGGEALYCVSPAEGARVAALAPGLSAACREALAGLGGLRPGESLRLDEEGGACRVVRGQMPASQRWLFGIPLDLNVATAAEIELLPGVGPKTAAAILDARRARGEFRALDELLEIKGIGPKTLDKLRPYVTVAPR